MYAHGSSHSFGAGGTNTWAKNWLEDFMDFWRAMDVWGATVMLFFQQPPPPPGTPVADPVEPNAQIEALNAQIADLKKRMAGAAALLDD